MPTAYCTTDDVQSRVGALLTLSVSTEPNLTEVSAWINQASARVNGALNGAGYATVPPTDEDDLLMLLDIVANYVALKVLYTAFERDQVPQSAVEILSGWGDFMLGLKNGASVLPSQLPTAGNYISTGYLVLNTDDLEEL